MFEQIKIIGIDEVGRGPLVGNVVAAAVVLDPNKPIVGLMDSKKLSEKKREQFADIIKENAIDWAIGKASAQEIDEINILQASLLAMQRAFYTLNSQNQSFPIKVDGNHCPVLPGAVEAIVAGDSKVGAISAASIIAKVERDNEMYQLHQLHPEYGFAQHKGYPTKQHLQALTNYGVLSQHRRSFKPVSERLQSMV